MGRERGERGLTRVSRLFSLFRKSESSGDVIKIIFSFCTITLANSRSYTIFSILKINKSKQLTSSFSKISANVRYIRSVLRLIQSWQMMRLPRNSNKRRSVLNSSSRLIINILKYPSSERDDICASSRRSCLITYGHQ